MFTSMNASSTVKMTLLAISIFLPLCIIFPCSLEAKQKFQKTKYSSRDILEQLAEQQQILNNLLSSLCPEGSVMNGIDAEGNALCVESTAGESAVKYVFISSQSYDGNLGGAAGADQKCQALADASGLAGGVYKAWVSDATSSPSTRFLDTTHSLPYVLPDGSTIIALGWEGLTSGGLLGTIDMDENGNSIVTATSWTGKVWTNTTTTGEPAWTDLGPAGEYICSNWTANASYQTSIYGRWGFLPCDGWGSCVPSYWTSEEEASCDQQFRLYCFQQ